jgi:predicted transcriptional regulator
MDFKTVFTTFIILIFVNKGCSTLLKIVEKSTENEIKRKGLMNVNLLNSIDYDDLTEYVFNYLEFKGYTDLQLVEENFILCYDGKEAVKVYFKKVNMNEEIINIKEVLEFITLMKEQALDKGLIITNGSMNLHVYDVVERCKEVGIYITCINGVELAYELRNLKELSHIQEEM